MTTRPDVICVREWQSCEVIEVGMEVREGEPSTRRCYWPCLRYLLDSKPVPLT